MIQIKNYLIKFILLILSFFLLFPEYSLAEKEEVWPQITASSAILMDAKSGRILWEKNSREPRPIASTTKIMTAILALENLKLEEKLNISQRASDAGESELYLSPGEERKVEELIYGLLLRSANDAAIALAEKTAGSVENFAALMNKKAKELGARNTNFTNPHGLKDGNHYSSAYDLALIARYALKNPLFAKIVRTKEYIIDWPNNTYPRVCLNHNRLLDLYPYATGVKTGYTKEAGYCLVGSASKDGLTLISVVLNAANSQTLYDESLRILEFGFKNYKRIKLAEKGKNYGFYLHPGSIEKAPLVASKSLYATIRNNSVNLQKKIELKKHLPLPIRKGQVLGKITYFENDLLLGSVTLQAGKNIRKPTVIERLSRTATSLIKYLKNYKL